LIEKEQGVPGQVGQVAQVAAGVKHLAEAAGLGERPRGILIWQNSSFPWECHVREIDPADMALGRQVAINRVNALTRIDPSKLHLYFDTSLRTISLPDWCRTAYMER
jgi:hypothetical protein